MNYCILHIKTQSSTFRIPEFQNFHKSFFLPPPTTMIGFAGSGLGYSPKKSQEYFDENNFQLGVSGISKGIAKDVWKYRKVKGNIFISDILTREILFENEFYLIYGNENEQNINNLIQAFNNPVYALTLGNSDSLAKVIDISFNKDITESDEVSNCLLEGDIVNEVIDNRVNGLDFSIYTTSDPITYDLPVSFKYKSDYYIRKVDRRKIFSFIGEKMKLNVKKKGLIINNIFIPVFNLN